MNSSVLRFTLDISKEGVQSSISVRQFDTAKTLEITLTDSGKPYIVGEGVTAIFAAFKPDDTISYDECEINGDTVIYNFRKNTATVAGKYDCEIRLLGADERGITSPAFSMIVRKRAVADEDIDVSEDERSVIDQIVVSETERVEAEKAREKACEAAVTNANSAANSAINAADKANTASDNAQKVADELTRKLATGDYDGADGYTPERGKDYWTEADKAEIKSYVDNAILNGAW